MIKQGIQSTPWSLAVISARSGGPASSWMRGLTSAGSAHAAGTATPPGADRRVASRTQVAVDYGITPPGPPNHGCLATPPGSAPTQTRDQGPGSPVGFLSPHAGAIPTLTCALSWTPPPESTRRPHPYHSCCRPPLLQAPRSNGRGGVCD